MTKFFNTLARHRRLIIIGLIFWIPVVIFMKLAGEIIEKEPLPFDTPLLLAIHAHATTGLDRFFLTITNLGGIGGVLVISVLAGIYLIVKKRYNDLLLLIGGVGGAAITNAVLKLLFHRDRPSLWPHLVHESSFSFPSGHAMASAALAMVIILTFWRTPYRWWVVAGAVIYTIVIGFSRLYLGVHYPSDILAGWSVSIVWVLLVALITSHFKYSSKATHTS